MRERAALFGGTLEAGPHAGGFRVRASLPVDQFDRDLPGGNR
jgi:signal transduction histidine kinase